MFERSSNPNTSRSLFCLKNINQQETQTAKLNVSLIHTASKTENSSSKLVLDLNVHALLCLQTTNLSSIWLKTLANTQMGYTKFVALLLFKEPVGA